MLVCARERPGRALNDRREKGAWKPLGSVFLLHDPDLEPSQMAPSGTVGLVLGAGPAGVRLAADARGFGCRTRVARHNLPSREPPGGGLTVRCGSCGGGGSCRGSRTCVRGLWSCRAVGGLAGARASARTRRRSPRSVAPKPKHLWLHRQFRERLECLPAARAHPMHVFRDCEAVGGSMPLEGQSRPGPSPQGDGTVTPLSPTCM